MRQMTYSLRAKCLHFPFYHIGVGKLYVASRTEGEVRPTTAH